MVCYTPIMNIMAYSKELLFVNNFEVCTLPLSLRQTEADPVYANFMIYSYHICFLWALLLSPLACTVSILKRTILFTKSGCFKMHNTFSEEYIYVLIDEVLNNYTVFHTKRSKNCVFDILLHISGINCPTAIFKLLAMLNHKA